MNEIIKIQTLAEQNTNHERKAMTFSQPRGPSENSNAVRFTTLGKVDPNELIELKKKFVIKMQENYESIYLWQLKNLYKKLMSDILKCSVEKQVVIKSQQI